MSAVDFIRLSSLCLISAFLVENSAKMFLYYCERIAKCRRNI